MVLNHDELFYSNEDNLNQIKSAPINLLLKANQITLLSIYDSLYIKINHQTNNNPLS